MSKRKYTSYFALEQQIKQQGFDVNRSDLIAAFTDGEKDSLRDLKFAEYFAFIKWIKDKFGIRHHDINWQQSPENRMRRKIYALFVKQMGYTPERLNEWCIKYGKYGKALQEHTHDELVVLTGQAEQVYKSFIKGL